MSYHLDYILGPLILAAVFLGLGYAYGRAVNMGKPLPATHRKMLLFGTVFVAGMGYVMAIVSALHWPSTWAILLSAIWGVILAFVAYSWRRRTQ
jgi:hypothetical protein